jgi:hypothetical protein
MSGLSIERTRSQVVHRHSQSLTSSIASKYPLTN